MKHGVLATVWLLVRTKRGVELKPYPNLRDHKIADCGGIQNAVDIYLDHLVSNFSKYFKQLYY